MRPLRARVAPASEMTSLGIPFSLRASGPHVSRRDRGTPMAGQKAGQATGKPQRSGPANAWLTCVVEPEVLPPDALERFRGSRVTAGLGAGGAASLRGR